MNSFQKLGWPPSQTAGWILAGLRPDEAVIALALMRQGLYPSVLADAGPSFLEECRREYAEVMAELDDE